MEIIFEIIKRLIYTSPECDEVSVPEKVLIKLSARGIGLLILALVALIWLGTGLIIYTSKATHKDESLALLTAINGAAQSNVTAWFQQEERTLQAIAENATIVEATQELLNTPKTPEALNDTPAQVKLREIMGWQTGYSEFEGYFLIDRNNLTLASARELNTGTPNFLADIPGFLDHAWSGEVSYSGLVHTDVPISAVTGEVCVEHYNLFFAAPVRDKTGEVVAVITSRVNPQKVLYPILAAHSFAQTGETYLVSAEGNLISPSRFDLINALNASCQTLGKHFHTTVSPKTAHSSALTKSVSNMLSGETGASFDPYPDYRNVPVVGAWTPLPEWNSGLITEQDASEVMKDIDALTTRLSLISGSITVIIALVGFAIGKTVQAHEADQRASWMFKNMSEGAFVLDEQGMFQSVNQSFCEQLGLSEGELLDQEIGFLKADLRKLANKASNLNRTGGARALKLSSEFTYDTNGRSRIFRITLSSLSEDEHSDVGGLCRDVTAEVETRQNLENAKKAAEATAAARSRLLQMIGHELRTPLNGIIGPLSIIEAIEDPQELKCMVAIATEHSNQLMQTVAALEKVAELESGAITIAYEDVHLVQTIYGLTDSFESRMGCRISFDHAGLTAPSLKTDKRSLEQILSELIKNACEHGTKDSGHVLITAREVSAQDGKSIEISVSDFGDGISPEDAEKLFSPFTRLGQVNTSKTRGMGMGLYISKKYAQLLGVDLVFDGTDTARTTFTLRLPIGLDQA